MGGSDQWGNIVTGIDLGRRMGVEHQLYALTCPLLTTCVRRQDGQDRGRRRVAQRGAASAYDYRQYWRNTEDADVARFLQLCSRRCRSTRSPSSPQLQGAEINEAKKVLATEATARVHGREAAEKAAATAQKTFEQGAAAEGLPTIEIPSARISRERPRRAGAVRARGAACNPTARRGGRSRAAR